ncbi:hypothetical protein [Coleofasciculus sp. E1-EBD-02]|uniref:hypothetical protein n=1 Tax=Coleofasciculus sp. E1-EBD-02 TaxID=3068481 RepID=UPI0033025804
MKLPSNYNYVVQSNLKRFQSLISEFFELEAFFLGRCTEGDDRYTGKRGDRPPCRLKTILEMEIFLRKCPHNSLLF